MVDGYSYSYNEKYDIERLTIGGTETEELPVYAAVNTDFSGLVDTIVARTGYVAPSAETVDDAKIIITDRTDLERKLGRFGQGRQALSRRLYPKNALQSHELGQR